MRIQSRTQEKTTGRSKLNNVSESPKIVPSAEKQTKPARLPYFFQFYLVFLPFVFFLFEFREPPNTFTDYQYYAVAYLLLSYLIAVFTAQGSLARIVFIVFTILALPIWFERFLADFIGTLPFVNPDFLYYGAGFLAIATGFLYLIASGFPRDAFYSAKCLINKSYALITALFAIASAVALFIYFQLTGKALAFFSSVGFPFYFALTIAFALANGIMEELMFRGLLQSVLARSFPIRFAVIFQALLFGIIHYNGTPSGAVGITLAFIFGLALGWLTARSNSILPAIVIHIVADFVIRLHL